MRSITKVIGSIFSKKNDTVIKNINKKETDDCTGRCLNSLIMTYIFCFNICDFKEMVFGASGIDSILKDSCFIIEWGQNYSMLTMIFWLLVYGYELGHGDIFKKEEIWRQKKVINLYTNE